MNVCLLVEGTTLPRWQADALAYVIERADVDVTTVVYNERERTRTPWETVKRGIELREWAVVGTLNDVVSRPLPQTAPIDLDAIVDLDSLRSLSVEPTIVDGWKQEIPKETVDVIAGEADVAIRFGFGFLVGSILSALPYGVLSYHHGDLGEYRGQPMGFWEFVRDEDTAGITVQQLTEELDAGRVAAVKTVEIGDLHTWGAVRRRLFGQSEDMLATAVRNLRDGRVGEPSELGALYTHPRGLPVLKFAVKNAKGHVLESL